MNHQTYPEFYESNTYAINANAYTIIADMLPGLYRLNRFRVLHMDDDSK